MVTTRNRKRARAHVNAAATAAAESCRMKALKRSYFDGLDDEVISKIIGFLGRDLYLGAAPIPSAALVPLTKINIVATPATTDSTPILTPRPSSKDVHISSSSHVYTHFPDAKAARNDDASNAGSALQALACLNQRLRKLVFAQCTTCVCTIPTLIPHAVRNMASCLTSLDLHHCGGLLHDHHCESLRHLRGIQHLNLSGCFHLTGQALAYLSKASQLTRLDLGKCRDISPSGFIHLPRSIRHLDLSYMNGHHTPLMRHLGRLMRLEHLDLTANDTMTSGLVGLEQLRRLTWLSIADSDAIVSSDLATIACLPHLRHLDLSNTHFSPPALLHLSALTALEFVCIDGCPHASQAVVDIVRGRSEAPAWEAVALPRRLPLVDPARVVLTAEPEAAAVAALQRRGRRSTLGRLGHSVGSAHSSGTGVWHLSG
eukprot:jgi/Ulvmu1/8145/UM040_0042.1